MVPVPPVAADHPTVIEVAVREDTDRAPIVRAGADAVTDSDVGFDNDPLFVVEIVLVPVDPAVYVNVAEGVPVDRLTVDGVNDPPPLLSLGVMVTPEFVPPDGVKVTVKFEDAEPTVQVDGPLKL